MGQISDYIDARIEQAKLKAADGVSSSLGVAVSICLALMLLMVVLSTLAFAVTLFIGELIGSYAAGAGIVCGFFLILFLLVWFLRKKLFRGMFIKMILKDDKIRSYGELEKAEAYADAKADLCKQGFASASFLLSVLQTLRDIFAPAAKAPETTAAPGSEQAAAETAGSTEQEPGKTEEQ